MKAWAWSGAAFLPAASIPIADRGFRYGMSLFESIRVWRSKALFLAPHLARLRHACRSRDFILPESALARVEETLASANADGFARIYVTAGDGALTSPPGDGGIYLLLEPRDHPPNERIRLDLAAHPFQPLFGGLKTGNYWMHANLLRDAITSSHDDVLLFNIHAELVSACTANVFIVKDGALLTPPLTSGARDGVIREWVISVASLPCGESVLKRDDVLAADEIFLTNSWHGIRLVSHLQTTPLPEPKIGSRLQEALLHSVISP